MKYSDYNGFWGDDNLLKLLYHMPVTPLYSALFVSGIHHIYFKKQNACFLVYYIKALWDKGFVFLNAEKQAPQNPL